MIELEGLTKNFGGRVVFAGVSARIARGESVALTGPSGAGKTTLLRCLNGLERADAGTLRVDDLELRAGGEIGEAALRALRRKVGFVFQQWHLFANLTVLENVVEAPVQVAGEPLERATTRARALLERVGIAHRAGARPHQLSGGEQQRAAIARALAMSPSVLLLDEPTSALDAERARELGALLRGLVDGGLTLVCVTHDLAFARALGARRLVLHEAGLREGGLHEAGLHEAGLHEGAPEEGAATLDDLARRFAALTLAKSEWTHHGHLRVGAWYVFHHGADAALPLLRAQIRRLNESHGVANTPTGGYHETITAAYVQLLAPFLASFADAVPLERRVEALLAGPLAHKELLLRFWSRDLLMSPRARAEWVTPDLAPLGAPASI